MALIPLLKEQGTKKVMAVLRLPLNALVSLLNHYKLMPGPAPHPSSSGYFAERAEELSLKVDVPKTNMILTSVVGALVGQPDIVRLAALSAVNHILPFAKLNFNTEAEFFQIREQASCFQIFGDNAGAWR